MSEHPNDPPSKPSFVVCSHCGRQWDAGTRVCPNCGSAQPNTDAWPPAPKGEDDLDSVPTVFQGTVQNGLALGCSVYVFSLMVFSGLSVMFWGMEYSKDITKLQHKAIVIAVLLGWCGILAGIYFLLRPTRPRTARGYGYLLLIAIALNLGMAVICAMS